MHFESLVSFSSTPPPTHTHTQTGYSCIGLPFLTKYGRPFRQSETMRLETDRLWTRSSKAVSKPEYIRPNGNSPPIQIKRICIEIVFNCQRHGNSSELKFLRIGNASHRLLRRGHGSQANKAKALKIMSTSVRSPNTHRFIPFLIFLKRRYR